MSLLPEPPYQHRGAFIHFAQRLRERVDPALDPLAHWWRISVAVERGDRAVIEFCGRINRTGRRIWRYRLDDKRTTFVVFDHSSGVPITVLTPDREIRCGSRKQKHIIDGVTYVL